MLCSNLESAYFPELKDADRCCFSECYKLKDVYMPKLSSVGNSMFYRCSALSTLSLPGCTSIGANAFVACMGLLSLYLMSTAVVQLQISGTFSYTPIAGYTTSTSGVYGSIFVPASLYDAYLSHSQWQYFSERIVSVAETEIAALE